MTDAIEPFHIRMDQSDLEDLRSRLSRTRFPDQIAGTEWDAGIPIAYLRELVEYWLDTYDWRREEARLNGFAHFRTRIDGQSIHFIHARSPHEDALPLLLTHGWPGSVVEFLEVIPRLTDPPAYGGRAADAFHVVAPSLPGYGFSEPPRVRGWDVRRIAQAFIALMACLDYRRYGAQGGDWGAQVTARIGALDPEHCAAIHLTDEEQVDLADMTRFTREEAAYANEQGTKPQTVGVGLNDSPAGLLAWIVEKFRAWSDCGGHPENCFSRDQLLTNVMLYWMTQTATSSAQLYWETNQSGVLTEKLPFIGVPTGVARYPKEVLRWPRSWVEQQFNVTHWAAMPRGGHFAAMEQPVLFADDLQEFFRTVR
jgi:epoxide hydrolase